MKVLALGATGAIGRQMVAELAAAGHEIHVTTRRMRKPGGSVRYLQGNARDPAFLVALLKERWDAIIDFMVYETVEFSERVDTLLAATDQYVFISSARVFRR